MAQFGTVITNIGLAKITNAQITQETVGIQHMVLGDGNGGYYTLSQSQTSLRREVWRGLIADEQRDPSNLNRIAFSAYIPSTAGGFTIREVGLLDTDGNLIAVSLYPEQYKPQLAEGVSDDLLLHFVLETSNASVVTLAVDPTIIIASRKYVDDKVAGAVGNIGTNLSELQQQVTKHLDEKASLTTLGHVQLSNDINSVDETKASTPKVVKQLNDSKADKQQENWITATLINEWTGSVKYFKDNFGMVHIAGYVSKGTATENFFLELPVGYRPSAPEGVFLTMHSATTLNFAVSYSGGRMYMQAMPTDATSYRINASFRT